MAKKKREHIVFDQMLKMKKSIPFSIVNKKMRKAKRSRIQKNQVSAESVSTQLFVYVKGS